MKKLSAFVFRTWATTGRTDKRKTLSTTRGPGKVAQLVHHMKFGEEVVVETKGDFIVANFSKVGKKQMNLKMCLEKGLMEFV